VEGVVSGRAGHVLTAAAAGVGNNGGWPVAPRRLPTGAQAASHSLMPVAHTQHHHQSQRNSEIHKFQRVSRPISISTENPNGGHPLPFCASEYEVRRYPKKACDWTNNDQQDAAHSFLFWPSWEVQNICCNVRAMFPAAMRHWPNVSMGRGEANEGNVRRRPTLTNVQEISSFS
jgi:hypothetical protein